MFLWLGCTTLGNYTEVKYAAVMSRLTFLNEDGADCHVRKIIYASAFASVIGSVNL